MTPPIKKKEDFDLPMTWSGFFKTMGITFSCVGVLASAIWFAASLKSDTASLKSDISNVKIQLDQIRVEEQQKSLQQDVRMTATELNATTNKESQMKINADISTKLDVSIAILERVEAKVNADQRIGKAY